MQAADRFMRLVERRGAGAPRHLVVFITSDEDFSENIAQLQSRNFTVEVLYHNPIASKKPVSIIHAANKAHAWLPFLTHHLNNPSLSLTYDRNQFAPSRQQSPIRQAKKQAGAPNAFTGPAAQMQPAAPSQKAMQRQTDGWLPDDSDSASSVTSSALVQVHGLVEGSPSIARRCEILLAQHISHQVADSTDITVLPGWNGPFAVLDFSKAHQPTQQAAHAVAALDGKEWYSSKLHVQLYNDGSAAASSSSLPTVTMPAAPPAVAKPVVLVVPRNNNSTLVKVYNKTGDGHGPGHRGHGFGQKHWAPKAMAERATKQMGMWFPLLMCKVPMVAYLTKASQHPPLAVSARPWSSNPATAMLQPLMTYKILAAACSSGIQAVMWRQLAVLMTHPALPAATLAHPHRSSRQQAVAVMPMETLIFSRRTAWVFRTLMVAMKQLALRVE